MPSLPVRASLYAKAGTEALVTGQHWIDAVIIKTDEKKRLKRYSDVSLKGRDVIVVQCKTNRLGMYFTGQTYLSMHLVGRHNPVSIQSVALCGRGDSVLRPIFDRFRIAGWSLPTNSQMWYNKAMHADRGPARLG